MNNIIVVKWVRGRYTDKLNSVRFRRLFCTANWPFGARILSVVRSSEVVRFSEVLNALVLC